ncbi:MAG: hypothetical protein ABL958_01460 [Bdellovibrionia bacterium]
MKFLTFVLLTLILAGCQKKEETPAEEASPSSENQMANSATESINGVLNSTGLIAQIKPLKENKNYVQILERILLPHAHAAACSAGGASVSACSGSAPWVRTATYNCTLGASAYTLSGTSTLTYNTANCNTVINHSVIRTVNATISGPLGTLTTSSDSHADYRGNTIGGGQQFVKTGAAGAFTVLGMHRVLTGTKGRTLFDISTRTTSDFTVTGSTLSDLTVDGGVLEIIHNLAQYTAQWMATSVAWSSSCSCPVSGSLAGTFSGSVTGNMTVQFGPTCGAVTVTGTDGATGTTTLDVCSSL